MEWVERSREDPAYVTMRYTILKAAPFATAAQLFERRTEMQQQVAGPLAVDEPRDGRAFLQGGALTAPGTPWNAPSPAGSALDDEGRGGGVTTALSSVALSRPLTSPETLARVAIEAALYTRPNTLRRHVSRTVVDVN